jgi:hypothetical protein
MVFNSKFLIDEIFRMFHESDRGGSAIFNVQKSCHYVFRINNYYSRSQAPAWECVSGGSGLHAE